MQRSVFVVLFIFFTCSPTLFGLRVVNQTYDLIYLAITDPDVDCRFQTLVDPIPLNSGTSYEYPAQAGKEVCVATRPSMPYHDRYFFAVLKNNSSCLIELGFFDAVVTGC